MPHIGDRNSIVIIIKTMIKLPINDCSIPQTILFCQTVFI